MVRRSLGVALWGVVGLLAGFLGALSALIGTGAGRNLIARAAEGALRQVFTGSIEIGDVGGTLLTGLTLSDVRLFDPDTTLVAWLPRAELSYNPLEFAAGRVVLFELALRQPVFNIVQHPSGRLNAEELLPLGGPGAGLRDVAGRITVVGDSLDADLERVRLPGSALQARGRVRWPRGTLLYDLEARADSATLADFRFIDSRFPDGAVVRGGVALRSHGSRVLEIRLDPLRFASGGGTVTGRLTALSAADSGLVALRTTDLEARDFDLEFARPFLDRLPLAGRLSGRTVAEGAIGALHLETDWVFRDSLVPGWPQSAVRGRGEVDLSRGAGVGFRSFGVDAATIDLGTVRRLVPAVRLQGVLDAAGTLTGRLADAQLSGTLRHRPRDLPPSVIRGVVRLDSRSDTLGVFADVVADSLSFDGLRASFPGGGLPLAGVVTGPVRLDGTLAALATHADLQSAQDGGGVRVDGVLTLLSSRLAARDFTVRARELDLSRWLASGAGPPSRLSVTLAGTVGADSGAAPAGAVTAALGPSLFVGAGLDSGGARLRFADRRVYVDSLRLSQPGLVTTGSGVLGWSRPARGALSLDLDADSLNSVDSLIAWVAGFGPARAGGGGTRDAFAWFARSGVGQVGAFLVGGRYARRADAAAVAVDSLALQIPGDVWVLHRPVEFVVTDSAARVASLALESVYGTGRLLLQGDLPTRGRADAHLQIEGFPLAGLYALLQRDTAGVGGTIGATAALAGTRAEPQYTGSFALTNGSIGEFRAPYLDGTFEYRDRRLQSAVHLWRSGQQVLTVAAHLPLALPLAPVERRQLPDTLWVRATADSVDLSLLEALTPLLKEVAGVFTADVGIAGTWEAPRLRGDLVIRDAAATIPTLSVRYEGITGRLALSGDTIRVDTIAVRSDRGHAVVSGFVRLEIGRAHV